jgi:hypothetical protein
VFVIGADKAPGSVALIRHPETKDELVGVTSDCRVEHHDVVTVQRIAQYVALAVQLEAGRYRVRPDELRIDAMHRVSRIPEPSCAA